MTTLQIGAPVFGRFTSAFAPHAQVGAIFAATLICAAKFATCPALDLERVYHG